MNNNIQIQTATGFKFDKRNDADLTKILVKQLIRLQGLVEEQSQEIKQRDEVIHELREIIKERVRWLK